VRRADHSSRGVLPSLACVCVCVFDREASITRRPDLGLLRHGRKKRSRR
jgi:hypothetical protein